MFRGGRYVYYLSCGDGFIGDCIYPDLSDLSIKYVQLFVYQLFLSKAVKTKKQIHKNILFKSFGGLCGVRVCACR